MWTCPKCNETHDDNFSECWKCSTLEEHEMQLSKQKDEIPINIGVSDFFRGNLSLGVAFWGYGILAFFLLNLLFSFIMIGLIDYFQENYQTGFDFFIYTSISFQILLWSAMSFGIWKCGKNSTKAMKRLSRFLYIGFGGIWLLGKSIAILLPTIMH